MSHLPSNIEAVGFNSPQSAQTGRRAETGIYNCYRPGAGREPRSGVYVVIGDPYLVVTVAQVHGINEVQPRSDVFPHRQTGGWSLLQRHKVGLNPNLTQPESAAGR